MITITDQHHTCEYMFVAGKRIGQLCGNRNALWTLANNKHYCKAHAIQLRESVGGMGVIRCRVCGCTDGDCGQCIAKTGKPCHWVGADLCSACVAEEANQ